jgi:ADP-heptose:LPS heptosyltransferase
MAPSGTGTGGGAVLVLRALGLGDLLVAVPALRAVRRWAAATHPGAELVLAGPRALGPLLGLTQALTPAQEQYAGRRPPVDAVLDLAAKDAAGLLDLPDAWRRTRAQRPLAAVNLHGSGPASHRALAALDPGRLVAFECGEAGVAGPPWLAPGDRHEHEAARWCRLVEEALGTATDPGDLHLDPPPAGRPGAGRPVVVHPGAADPSRRWPPDRWAAVAHAVVAAGHPVVLTGGPDEVALAEDVRRRAGLPGDTVLAGRTGLGELAALVAGARLVVCGDTGVAHLASAYRTPSVVLFGPTSPARWGPPATGPHTVLWHGRVDRQGSDPGDPHGRQPDPTLLRVTPEEVVAAVQARLVGGDVEGVRPPGGRTSPTSA